MNGDDMELTIDEPSRENIPFELHDTKINRHLTVVTVLVSSLWS